MEKRITKVNLKGKEVKRMRKVFLIFLLILLLGVSTVYALPLAQTAFVPGVINTISDDDGEVLVDNVGIVSPSPLTGVLSPTVDVGDYLVGVIGITSFPTSGVPVGNVNQLTGVFAVEVTSVGPILPDSLAFPRFTGGGGGVTGATASFGFAPVVMGFNAAISAAFPNLFTDLGIGGFTDIGGGALPASTVAIVFEGPPNDFARSNPGDINGNAVPNEIDDAALAAANGTERMVIGTTPGDFWTTAFGPVWIGDALIEALLSPTLVSQVGAFSASLTILSQNFPGLTLGPDFTITNAAFSGDANPGIVPWPITSNADFQFNVVPEPGTFFMLGIGLFGLWFTGRRIRKS